MRTAAANEDSVVEDGQSIALPPTPALSTRNMVLATGSAVQVIASSSDSIRWPEQATPQSNSVVVPAGSSLTFFYATGTWWVIAEGNIPLSGIETIFSQAGQLLVGTGASTGELLTPGPTGTALMVGGTDPSGLLWTPPTTIGTTRGAPTSGTWLAGQIWLDSVGNYFTCTAGGTPGTWSPPNEECAIKSYCGTQTLIGASAVGGIQNMINEWSIGGMTVISGNAVQVPFTAAYHVTAGIFWQSAFAGVSAAGMYQTSIYSQEGGVNSEQARSTGYIPAGSLGGYSCATDLILNAGDLIFVAGGNYSVNTQACYPGSQLTWLTAHLIYRYN